MHTTLITHSACLYHDMPPGHPECADRLRAVLRTFESEDFFYLHREEAPAATLEQLTRVHPKFYVESIMKACPAQGEDLVFVDGDTALSHGSAEAMLRAAGAVIAGVDQVVEGRTRNAFCAVRPPGHHADATTAMGFCFFNNVVVGALHAREVHGLERAAIIDFDVHHGNGTQDLCHDDERLFYASTHQAPLFPGTGKPRETGIAHNIVNHPLPPGAGGEEFRSAMSERILPRLDAFRPDIIFISAGFDGHRGDPLADLNLLDEDFAWATREIMSIAEQRCGARIVSALEGGYDLAALASSAAAHVRALMGA